MDENTDQKHPSHKTRISFGASSYDEICDECGATDKLGSWGLLALPCPKVEGLNDEDRHSI